MNDNFDNSKSNNKNNNTNNNNNNQKNKKKNEEKNNTKKYDVYIICKQSNRINFKSSNEVGEYLSNFRHINALTQEHLLKIISNRTKEDYYIKHLLSPFLLCETNNKFGSLHYNNQILLMSNEEFSRLKDVATNVENDDSIRRKIRECLSEASPSLFLFRKLYPIPANHVVNFLENSLHILNNNNNNNDINDNYNNNENNYNDEIIENDDNKFNNDNNNNDINDNNNENNYNDDIIENDDNKFNNNNNIQNENDLSSSDDMEIDQIIPPSEPPPNIPSFNPNDDHLALDNGVGFDGETLSFICSSEMLTDELFYSNLIEN